MALRREEVVDTLRHRILAALGAGVLRRGDRLASTRELGRELGADPRLIAHAYRELADEGLVALRSRSGIFVGGDGEAPPAESWVVSVLAQGIAHGVPAPALGERLRLSIAAPLRAVAIATTLDQTYGICRELHDDYGLTSESAQAELLLGADGPARAEVLERVRRADLLVTTEAHAATVARLARELGVPHVAITIRHDLVGREWRALLRTPAYVVAVDPRFCELLQGYLRALVDVANLRLVLAGRDDPGSIPEGAPVYVTQAARRRLGAARVPGRLLEPARLFSAASAREILTVMVRANAAAAGGP